MVFACLIIQIIMIMAFFDNSLNKLLLIDRNDLPQVIVFVKKTLLVVCRYVYVQCLRHKSKQMCNFYKTLITVVLMSFKIKQTGLKILITNLI